MPQVTRDPGKVGIPAHLSPKAMISALLGILCVAFFLAFPRSPDLLVEISQTSIVVILTASIALLLLTGIVAVLLSSMSMKEIRVRPDESKGLGFAYAGKILGIIGCVLGLMMIYASPGFIEAVLRSKVSRDEVSLRTLAIALENYRIDDHYYPPDLKLLATVPDLQMRDGQLTERGTHIKEIPRPKFGNRSVPNYYCSTHRWDGGLAQWWVVWTPGPDGDYDLLIDESLDRELRQHLGNLAGGGLEYDFKPLFSGKTYDPTNGSYSSGDIIRVKG